MKVTSILAAPLKFDFDYSRIYNEMISCRDQWIYTPPYKTNLEAALKNRCFQSDSPELYDQIDYIDNTTESNKIISKNLRAYDIFYLTHYKDFEKVQKNNFDYTKHLDPDQWEWRSDLKEKIRYTTECIESLPFSKLGCVRAFICENTFFPTHRDTVEDKIISQNYETCLGVSIIPSTGNVPMLIQSPITKKVFEVHGNAMLFNDSAWHGVPLTTGARITIRIFGEIDFQLLEPFLEDPIYTIFSK